MKMKKITSKEEALTAVKQDGISLRNVSEELKNNKEFLYEIKDVLIEYKEYYPNEYELLKRYEREDELNNQLEEKGNNQKKLK